MKHQNLAVEALKSLLNGEFALRRLSNVVCQEKAFLPRGEAIAPSHNRNVDAIQFLQELTNIANGLCDKIEHSVTSEERAFYDALARNISVVDIMGHESLRNIATELVQAVRSNVGTLKL